MKEEKIRVLPLPKIWEQNIGDHVIDLKWSSSGNYLAAASVSGPVSVWEGKTGAAAAELSGHALGTQNLDWHPGGTLLASGGQDSQVAVWNIPSGEVKKNRPGKGWVECVRWNHDGTLLAAASGKKVFLLNPDLGIVRELPEHKSTVTDLAWHPSRNELVTTAYAGPRLWSVDAAEPLQQFQWPGASLQVAWSPDGKFVVTADQTPTVHFWDLPKNTDLQMSGYEGKVKALSWNHQSRFIATGGGISGVVWDCSGKGPEGSTPIMLEAHFKPITALHYQHKNNLLVSGSLDSHVYVWWPDRSPDPLLHHKLKGGASRVAWAPDDQSIALGSEIGEVLLVRLPTEAEMSKSK